MAILTPPASFCGLLSTSLMLSPIVTSSPVSSFNQRSTVSGPISEFWRAQIVLPPRKQGSTSEAGWRDTAAFLMQLRGGVNLCRLFDPRRHPMRGAGSVLTTAAVASEAPAGATSVTLKGLKPSQIVALAADDHFTIGENLYTVISHAGSDLDGEATVSFLPPLRHGVATDDAVHLNKPTGVFRLVGGFSDLTVSFTGRAQPLSLEFFEDPVFEI
ncbi:MAG: hypothetical protein ACO1OK_00300 [Devosia sp.]